MNVRAMKWMMMIMNDAPGVLKPMSREQVQNFIMLAAQRKERWFEIRFTDEEMNKQPEAIRLMNTISDMVQEGICTAEIEEHFDQAKKMNGGIELGTN